MDPNGPEKHIGPIRIGSILLEPGRYHFIELFSRKYNLSLVCIQVHGIGYLRAIIVLQYRHRMAIAAFPHMQMQQTVYTCWS